MTFASNLLSKNKKIYTNIVITSFALLGIGRFRIVFALSPSTFIPSELATNFKITLHLRQIENILRLSYKLFFS